VIKMGAYYQDGDLIDHTPTGAVAAGDVVQIGKLVGVAPRPIAANALGAVAIEGVFYLPKPTGAGTDYAAGSKVYWYSGAAVTGVTGVQAGYTIAAAATTDTSVRVTLFPGS
jgi:predicted RecA/RadA family phage recombinase